jgi:hypothetical protein
MPPPMGGMGASHLGHHGFGGDEQGGHRGGILESIAHHLGGVDDACGVDYATIWRAPGYRYRTGQPAPLDTVP